MLEISKLNLTLRPSKLMLVHQTMLLQVVQQFKLISHFNIVAGSISKLSVQFKQQEFSVTSEEIKFRMVMLLQIIMIQLSKKLKICKTSKAALNSPEYAQV